MAIMTTRSIFGELTTIDQEKKALASREKELKAVLKTRLFEQTGVKKQIAYENGTASWVAESENVGFDEKAFASDYPELYAQYRTKVSKKAGYVRFTPAKAK